MGRAFRSRLEGLQDDRATAVGQDVSEGGLLLVHSGLVEVAVPQVDARELGIDDEDQIGSECVNKISDMWSSPLHQSLRWTHVGLLAAGELLYLANAATGIGMMSRDRPGLTAQDLHRYAFFIHGVLMVAEIIMGFLTTEVLKNGSHEEIQAFGIVHSAIGLTIPIVIIGSGIAVNRGFPGRFARTE